MRYGWLLAVMCACAMVASQPAFAAEEEDARTTWDTIRGPHSPWDQGEYMTGTTDHWIRLTPEVRYYVFDESLDLDDGVGGGLSLEFEPGETLLIGMRFSYASIEREVEAVGFTGTDTLDGDLYAFNGWIYIINPELRFGPIQLLPGLGATVFYLADHDGNATFGVPGGGSVTSNIEFEDTWVVGLQAGLRIEFDTGDHFRLGLDLNGLFPFYASGDFVGDLEESSADFGYWVFEPALYAAIRF